MTLKAILDSLDDVDESLHDHYDETGGGTFVLKLDGIDDHPLVKNLKSAHDVQKAKTRELKEELTDLKAKAANLPDGFSAEKWEEQKARIAELENSLEDGDVAEKFAKQKELLDAQWQAKLERADREAQDKLTASDAKGEGYKTTLHRTIARHVLAKALRKVGVIDNLADMAESHHVKNIQIIEEDGAYRAVVDVDGIEQSVPDYIEAWSQSDEGKSMVAADQNSGADAKNKDGHRSNRANPWKKSTFNLSDQGRITKEDPKRADRLKREAKGGVA